MTHPACPEESSPPEAAYMLLMTEALKTGRRGLVLYPGPPYHGRFWGA